MPGRFDLISKGKAIKQYQLLIRHYEIHGFFFSTANDRGEGFLEGSCSGGVLTIILHATKAVELKNVQWAADEWVDWQQQHGGMNTCQLNDGICDLSTDGKTMTIRVPGSDTMAFAVNVIYGYILPTDWTTNPELATCVGMYTRGNHLVIGALCHYLVFV